ncbi:MAG: MaoC/PaaZ C-terminal domain-containing protein [Solirubrobacteraceae bacterium]
MTLARGDEIGLQVTPDAYVTIRYAGASLDFNPIHLDEQFAREVGLPGRILHGMWTMAQVARALTDAGGGPQTLRSLQVQFRGAGRIGEEVVVSGVVGEVDRERAIVSSQVTQGGRRIIRNAVAELRIR